MFWMLLEAAGAIVLLFVAFAVVGFVLSVLIKIGLLVLLAAAILYLVSRATGRHPRYRGWRDR